MLPSEFIQQANIYGQSAVPFFFLIDFEKQKPFIAPLDQLATHGIFYQFAGKTNFPFFDKNEPIEPLQSSQFPISLNQYQQGFDHVQYHLQQGNTYLLNLTYPTKIQTNYSLTQLFERTNAAFKLLYQSHFVCFSPESFVRTSENQIFTYPMKGTIDAMLPDAEQQLLNNVKERYEHNTIVDLLRNDLAMVAHTIEVRRFRYVEKLKTERGAILQTSSEIVGQLADNWQCQVGDILWTLLPAGSVSGAPKEKTLEIIQQAEQQDRGYYTGVFGIFDGENMQSAVAIRFIEQRGNDLFFRSGGGITSQSVLEEEYQELLQKVYIPIRQE